MTFKKWSLALVALMLTAPLSASALGISIAGVSSTGASTTQLEDGDIITFDLLVENASYEQVFGLGLGVYGYDTGNVGSAADNHLAFAGGTNVDSILNQVFLPGPPPVALGGIDGVSPVSESGAPFPVLDPRRVQLFNGVSTSGTTGDGTSDIGINGLQTNGSDVHIQVSFAARDLGTASGLNPQSITLEFGTGQFGNAAIGNGGAILPFNNAFYTVTVVPEPGTALLMGLGLAGLAANRRR